MTASRDPVSTTNTEMKKPAEGTAAIPTELQTADTAIVGT